MMALAARHDRHGFDEFRSLRRADVRQRHHARHQSACIRDSHRIKSPHSFWTSRPRPCRAASSKSISAKRSRSKPGGRSTPRAIRRLARREALKGALLPLGGFGVDNGGHKGYGFGLLVDILCGVLCGGAFGNTLPLPSSGAATGRDLALVRRVPRRRVPRRCRVQARHGSRNCGISRRARKAPGAERIYVAGEIEYEKTAYNREHGVPVHHKVWDGLQKLGARTGDTVTCQGLSAVNHREIGAPAQNLRRHGSCQRCLACRIVHGRKHVVLPLHRASGRDGLEPQAPPIANRSRCSPIFRTRSLMTESHRETAGASFRRYRWKIGP